MIKPAAMKVLRIIVFLCTVGIVMLLVSCVDDEPSFVTTAELISGNTQNGRSYFIRSAEIDIPELNGTLVLDECVTDNTIIYYPNGRYEQNEGPTKCNPEDLPGLVGEWTLSSGETQMFITIDGVTELWEIIQVSESGHSITRESVSGQITYILERFL